MTEKTFESASGTIHYWMNDVVPTRKTIVFLPGLTADLPYEIDCPASENGYESPERCGYGRLLSYQRI